MNACATKNAWMMSLVAGWAGGTLFTAALLTGTPLAWGNEPPPPPPAAPQVAIPAENPAANPARQGDEAAEAASDAPAATPYEVRLYGPLHEAFAEQFQLEPRPGLVVSKQPPPALDEVPPDVRPAGNVVWAPGYWGWEAAEEDFLWISGAWRVPPPGHRWVPGYWQPHEGQFRWVSGFWLRADVQQTRYLPPPPASQERGPTQPPPGGNSFWVPGCWEYRQNQYAWRPGYWSSGQENWVWIPSRYVWTPRGAIFVAGHWDARLESRGWLFAPIALRGDAEARAALRYRPEHVIDAARLRSHLFVHAATGQYLFGDYYAEEHLARGIQPWHVHAVQRQTYDPLYAQAQWLARRAGRDLAPQLTAAHEALVKGVDLRPARTLADQTARLAALPAGTDTAQATLGRTLQSLAGAAGSGSQVARVTAQQQTALAAALRQTVSLSASRLRLEGDASANAAASARVAGAPLNLPPVAVVPGVTDVPSRVAVPETLERVLSPATPPKLPLPGTPNLPQPPVRPPLPLPRLPL